MPIPSDSETHLLWNQLSEFAFASDHILATRDHATCSVDIGLGKVGAVEVLILKKKGWTLPDLCNLSWNILRNGTSLNQTNQIHTNHLLIINSLFEYQPG